MKSFREYINLIEDAQQPMAEAIPVSKYAKSLASIAKERQEWITDFTGLPTTKEQKIQRKKEGALYAKAAELFAAGDIDGGSKIITQNISPQHQDYFRHFMEEYKIPTNLVFGDAERHFPAPKGQWTGAFNGDAKLEKKIRARLEQLHDSETMEPEEVYDQVADEFGISTELLDQWLSGEDDEYYNESAEPDAVRRIEQLVQYK